MENIQVDVAVIGAGTAGLAAYRAAVAQKKRTVLIESGTYGTTCARVGCMPSKLLIAAAEAAHSVSRWPTFGLHGTCQVDGAAVLARVKRERDRFVGFVVHGVENIPAHDKRQGRAHFLSPDCLQVDNASGEALCRIKAERIVIATGSRPFIPPELAAVHSRVVVNDDIFSWNTLPQSVAVIGTGVIGLELGQALHRLGVKVSLIGRGARLGVFADPVVREVAAAALAAELPLYRYTQLTAARLVDHGVALTWCDEHGACHEETVEYLIAAAGRIPNVDQLGLQHSGLALDQRGIPYYDPQTMQCGDSAIFIAGDANGDLPLLHEAADEGKIAGDNAVYFPQVTAGLRRTPLAIVFTEPQMAVVNGGYAALPVGVEVVCGRVDFSDQGRSRVMLQNQGCLHVYAERASGRFLGAELVAPAAEHLAHLLAWAHQMQLTVPQMLQLPFYHPVIEEGLRTALRDAAAQLSL